MTASDAFLPDSELATTKSAFSAKFNGLIWILTAGLQFAIGWWYRKSAVFYLPPNWFGPLTWTLALPFAPPGESQFFNLVSRTDGSVTTSASRFCQCRGLADGMP